MSKTQAEKMARAFGAYFELLDAAVYMQKWMRGPLEKFGLTMQGFRLLVYLCRDGALPMALAAKKVGCKRQNVNVVVEGLEGRGYVKREKRKWKAIVRKAAGRGQSVEERAKEGQAFVVVRLTPKGEHFMASVLPRHGKVVKGLMCALEGREQATLEKLCQKLRAGDVMKFLSEMQHADEWQEIEAEEAEETTATVAAAETRGEIREVKEVNEVKEIKGKTTAITPAQMGGMREAKEAEEAREAEEKLIPPSQGEGGAPGTTGQVGRAWRMDDARTVQQRVDEILAEDLKRPRTPRPVKLARKRRR